ncbi:HEAT repeat domain-containing protein [Leptolyngbya cf. ectocarpi LEGE 11479]|uniref:HEAT repeat domain-containing protein n=1 Tax=Leptolyngbya cf. ectocarpi LEGE 11479 TaxID=1828722 RepID=A0A929FAW9_LEPEC|nr:HEAT repeat domain-containing protein [Leptolyngbya ectocarpi]MBE9068514.1 HEAT repeat domain-containing protein [Leptolyngbya cf. ectocarpi LEGE 11479]
MIYFSDWWTIFEALERIGNLQVISELISVFESSDSNQRYQAVEVVGRLCNFLNLLDDEVVIGRIVNLLADEDYLVRAKAAEALGGFNTQKVIEKLSPKLKDETREVREAATAALGYIKTESSVLASIENLLNDQTQKVRCYAAQSLVKLSGVNIADLGVSRALSRSSKTKLLDDDLTYQLQAIQKNCKFYNYEIWQEFIQNEKLEIQNEDRASASQTTYIFSNATAPKIFERVDHYHEKSSTKEPPS